MPAIKTAELAKELQSLSAAYQKEGFTKLASRLAEHVKSFKVADDKEPDPLPIEEENKVNDEEEEDEEDSCDDMDDAGGDEEEASADDVSDDDDDEECEGCKGGEEEEEDADAEDGDDDDDDDLEEEDASEDMDEDIAMRDACTKIFRAAKKVSTHPNPTVRELSKRLLKVERLLRATL